jgi:hypothetical protein
MCWQYTSEPLCLSPESFKINNTVAGLLTRSTFNAFPYAYGEQWQEY